MTYIYFFIVALAIIPLKSYGETLVLGGKMSYQYEISSKDQSLLDNFTQYETESNSQKVIQKRPGKIIVENIAQLNFFSSTIVYPVENLYRSQKSMEQYLVYSTTLKGYIIKTVKNKRTKEYFEEQIPINNNKIQYLSKIANDVVKECKTQTCAVEKIISYVRNQVKYQLGTSNDPVDVLKTGKAYCEGYANASMMLLRVLGIPARFVECYIAPGHMWGLGSKGSGGFHAFIEVYYQDKGWVSYDPQASLHYVDPFHIVNFPRQKVKIKELSITEEQTILDAKMEPTQWSEFYMRQSSKEQQTAIIVGKIKNRKGELIKDSYNTNQWVYQDKGEPPYEGVKILGSGWFAIPIYNKETGYSFFFDDGIGGYIYQQVQAENLQRKELLFDLSDDKSTNSLIVPNQQKEIIHWKAAKNNDWTIRSFKPNKDGTAAIIISDPESIFSQSKNVNDTKYLFRSSDFRDNRQQAVQLDKLPIYLDPNQLMVMGEVFGFDDKPSLATVILGNGLDKYYKPVKTNESGFFTLTVQDKSFTQLIVKGSGFILINELDFTKKPHQNVQLKLNSYQFHQLNLTSGKKSKVYFNRREGNRLSSFVSATTDDMGKLNFKLPDGQYYVSIGTQFSRNMKVLKLDEKNPTQINID